MSRKQKHRLPSDAASTDAAYIISLHFGWLDEYVTRGIITKGQRAEISRLYNQGIDSKHHPTRKA